MNKNKKNDRVQAAKARAPSDRSALQRPLPKAPRERPAPLRLSARRQACRPVRPPLREHAPPAFKRRREKHMRPAAAQNIRAQSGKSGPQNRWRCGRYPFVTQISLFVSEFLFSCMRLCSDTRSNVPSKAQAAFCPACIRGTFSYFTAPSFNLYIGPPSYFVSFRKSDLYIPVPPFVRLPSRARLSMLDFGPLRTPSV